VAQRIQLLLCLLLSAAASSAEERPSPSQSEQSEQSVTLALTHAQQQAAGIQIDHPLPFASAQSIEAYGLVLDPLALVTDAGRMDSTQAAASAAEAEVARLDRLYRNDSQASLKSLQAAQTLAVEATTQAQAAAMSFQLQWGPVAALNSAQRRTLIESMVAGRALLLSANVPGNHIGGAVSARALVEVDGLHVAARVLGPLPRTDAQSQGAVWLLQIERRPLALGPGARTLVRLNGAAVSGLLLPATALLYAEQGAYVYRQISAGGDQMFQYAPVTVKLLARVGEGWLVDGLARTDNIVVQGTGVLWSLQGISSFSAAEDEHD
jgi:hypothetical protein